MKGYFTIREACELLDVSQRTVQRWVRDGSVESTLGNDGKRYISAASLAHWRATRTASCTEDKLTEVREVTDILLDMLKLIPVSSPAQIVDRQALRERLLSTKTKK